MRRPFLGIPNGKLSDIPRPHVRFYPDHGPRPVQLKLLSWRGMGVGARHFYPEFVESANPVWNSRTGQWQLVVNDPESIEHCESQQCTSRREAVRYVESMILLKYHLPEWEVYTLTERPIAQYLEDFLKRRDEFEYTEVGG